MPRSSVKAAVIGLVLLPAALPGAGASGDGPADYTAIEGLSEPVYETRRDHQRVEMRCGVELAVEITRPAADGQWPTILELSPYLGLLNDAAGIGFLGPDDQGDPVHLADYFAPRGYAVIHPALRGTGRSSGCLQLVGPTDRADAYELVEWVAAQSWSDGHVGMAGHS